MPFAIANLSITHHILIIAGTATKPASSAGTSALWLLAIGAVWLAIALVRLSRSEFSASEA